MHKLTTLGSIAAATALAALLAACGGGGGGTGGSGGGGGGGGVTPPGPSITPNSTGQLMLNGAPLANAKAVYTCGCSAQAGLTGTDGSGNMQIQGSTNAIPAQPQPTYTAVPGRNYLIIGYAPSSHAQVWTMEFLGNSASTNLNLAGSNSGFSDDIAATAAALYVYYDAGVRFSASSDQSFDQYNFNTMVNFAKALRNSPNTAEKKLLSDVASAQAAGTSMYPGSSVPAWNPDGGVTQANLTITSDLKGVSTSGDAAIPTPCPASGCTGAPSP